LNPWEPSCKKHRENTVSEMSLVQQLMSTLNNTSYFTFKLNWRDMNPGHVINHRKQKQKNKNTKVGLDPSRIHRKYKYTCQV